MGIQKIDPKKVKLLPESLPEAVNCATVPVTGYEFCAYNNFSPYVMEFERLVVEHEAAWPTDTVISADGFAEKMRLHNACEPLTTMWPQRNKLIAKNSLVGMMYPVGGAEANLTASWNVTMRKPSIIDKIRMNIQLSQKELELATSRNLWDRDWAGAIPKHADLLGDRIFSEFDEIIEVSKRLPAIAATTEVTVGTTIKVPTGYLYAILAIGNDVQAPGGGAMAVNDCYLYLDRDYETDYIQLDMAATTDLDYDTRCYIPAIDKIRFHVGTTAGLAANHEVRFLYGVRKLTLMDYVKWGMVADLSTEDQARAARLIEENDLETAILCGVLE